VKGVSEASEERSPPSCSQSTERRTGTSTKKRDWGKRNLGQFDLRSHRGTKDQLREGGRGELHLNLELQRERVRSMKRIHPAPWGWVERVGGKCGRERRNILWSRWIEGVEKGVRKATRGTGCQGWHQNVNRGGDAECKNSQREEETRTG